jgi:hypothetical protein
MPSPLVTTDDGRGNQRVLFGESNISFDAFSGFRFTVGAWFDTVNNIGMELNAFSLQQQSTFYSIFSDSNGNPPLNLSFVNRTPGTSGEYIYPVTVPGQFAGDIQSESSIRLWGAEANGVFCLWRNTGPGTLFEFSALAGFRYLDLAENFWLTNSSTDVVTFNTFDFYDNFYTRNQFYGGQIGARINWEVNRFGLNLTAKLAMGDTHQTVDVQGNSYTSGIGYGSGGFYAQPSNSGHFTANQFGVVPAVELRFSYQLRPWLRAFVGYDFLYWNQVVRPGDQIDRNLNLTQSNTLGNGVLAGPALPGVQFNRTDFWAQGATFGLEVRY